MPPAVRERLSGRSVLPPRAALVLCPAKAAAELCVRTKAIRDVRGRKTWPRRSKTLESQAAFRARPAFSIGDAWCCGGACRWVGAVLRRCLPRRRRRRHRRRRRPSLVPSRVVHKANTGAARPLGAFARAGTSRRPSRPADWGVQRRLARQYVLHVFSSPCIKTSDAAQAGTCPVPRLALTLTPPTIANGTPVRGECGVLDL